jgi:hypothetical protein
MGQPQGSQYQYRAESRAAFDDVFGDEVDPGVYERNAFRLTGLPVTASARDVRRRSDELTALARLGGAAPPSRTGVLPLSPPPSIDAVQAAIEELRDPVSRLAQELFWFWPAPAGQTDEGLQHLAAGNADAAAQIWRGQATANPVADPLALHNYAVLAHVRVLEAEKAWAANQTSGQTGQLWADALGAWKAVIDNDGVWQWLDARVQELNDPRLTPGTTGAMRSALPTALLAINSAIAVKALEAGQGERIQVQAQVISGAGMPAAAGEKAFSALAEPMVAKVRRECKKVADIVESDLKQVPGAIHGMLEQTARPLWVLDLIYRPGVAARDGAHDDVALTALAGLIAAQSDWGDERTAQQLLARAKSIAATEPAVARINENLDVIDEIVVWTTCWFCGAPAKDKDHAYEAKMYGDVQRQRQYNSTRVTWKSGSVKLPRCANCKSDFERNNRGKGWFIAGISLLVILGIVSLCTRVGWIGTVIGAVGAIGLGFAMIPFSKPVTAYNKRVKEFPAVAEQLRKGWQLGEKPST